MGRFGFNASLSLIRRLWLYFLLYSDQDCNLGKFTFTFSKTSRRQRLSFLVHFDDGINNAFGVCVLVYRYTDERYNHSLNPLFSCCILQPLLYRFLCTCTGTQEQNPFWVLASSSMIRARGRFIFFVILTKIVACHGG